jgi:hypothetical protein
MSAKELIRIMLDLRSIDGENTEYDRALAEVLAEVLGIDKDTAAYVLGIEA